jgi:hypothetical protein
VPIRVSTLSGVVIQSGTSAEYFGEALWPKAGTTHIDDKEIAATCQSARIIRRFIADPPKGVAYNLLCTLY